MKNTFKRLMAALMLVCMLLSFVVPATFAEDPAQPGTTTYDFNLGGSTDDKINDYTWNKLRLKDPVKLADGTADATYSSYTKLIQGLYADESCALNWYVDDSSYKLESSNIRTNEGLRSYSASVDGTMVLRLKAPTAEPVTYNVALNVSMISNTADIYLLPATDDLDTALAAATPLFGGTVTSTGVKNDQVELSGEEFILVIKHKSVGGSNAMSVKDLTLTPVADTPDVLGADVDFKFDVVNDYAEQCAGVSGKYFTGSYSNGTVEEYLTSLYPSVLNWKYEGSSTGSVPNVRVRATEGLRLYGAANEWIAFRLSGITQGLYDIAITSTGGGNTVDAYLIPDSQNLDIAAGLTPENLLKADVTATAVLAENRELSGGDYIVVLKTTAQDGNKYFRISKLSFTAVAEETPEESGSSTPEGSTPGDTTPSEPSNPVPHSFDFKLYANDTYMAFVKDKLVEAGAPADCVVPAHNLYKATVSEKDYNPYKWFNTVFPNTINWGVEGTDGDRGQANKFGADYFVEVDNQNGLRVGFGNVDDGKAGWVAFRIDVKAAGIYKIDLNMLSGSDSNHIATGDILDLYIFEKYEDYAPNINNTSQINEVLGEENYAGSLTYDESKTAYTIRSGYTFPKAGEYVIVLRERAEDTCRYAHLDTLTLTPTDTADDVETHDDLPKEEEIIPPDPDKDGDFTFDVVTNYPTICGGLHISTYTNAAEDKNGRVIYGTNGKQMSTEAYMASLYDQGYVDWVLEAYSFQNGKGLGSLVLRQNEGLRFNGTVGDWAAFRVKVPAAGEYNLKITGSGTNAVDLYFVKAADGMDMTAAMTAENLLIADLKSASAVAVKEKVALEASDYILIVKHTASANSGKDYWSLNRLQLETWKEKVAKPATDKMVYDFDMVAMDELFMKKSIGNRLVDGGISAKAQVAQWYAEGKVHWVYEGNGAGMKDMSFRENAYRIRTKTGNFKSIEDSFVAFRIENPGTDTYDVRLVTDGASMVCMNVYIVPLKNTLVLGADDIKAAMTKDNLLVSNAQVDKEGTFYLGEYTFGMEDEYLMVFEFTKGTALFLSQVEMTKDGLVADGTVKHGTNYKGVVYDLDLNDAMAGIYSESKLYMPDVIDDMNARWNAGTMNWKFAAGGNGFAGQTVATAHLPSTGLRFYRAGGLRAYGDQDAWFAIKIKSPGSGDFTITLNHATCPNSGTLALYVLPADTAPEDMWAATDPENRIGKVVLTNETGAAGVEDGKTSFVGYWNFEADKEYILVLECYEHSKFHATRSYMNISQIIMERGIVDYTSAEDEKRAEPVTVVENALPIADPGAFAAVTEVNGHDYYFLPLEGKYMLVYDLDTRELVDKVYTGIKYARHAQVGPDGRIYLASSGYIVWAYDPITKEIEVSPNVINTPGLEDVQGFTGMAIDEDGIIWLGAYYGGYLVSYNVTTREFTNYGLYNGYQNRITGMNTRGNYVYFAVHGDTEDVIFKVDKSTGEVAAKQDITHLMGDPTDYIDMINFLGDDLLVVGGSNMLSAAVMNPDTLEFVDHNLYACANIGATEEIDGKYYLVLQGYGLYQYDTATKEFSKVPGFGTSGIGFRTGGQNSFGKTLVTIDDDPCLFTYTASGGHPRMFNLNTKEYISWDDLVVHGSGGSSLRGFIQWEEGSNRFSFGGYNTTLAAVYNTELGKIEYYYNTGGQTDCQIWYEGKLYAGNYSSTTLNEIYPDENNTKLPAPTEMIQRWRLDHNETGQKRVHALAAGDGYVFAGTCPTTDQNGGGIVTYDTRTGRWKFKRNVIENQSVNGLAYYDGLLYGTTTTSGGSGAEAMGSAVVFVDDYNTEETIAVLDPLDYISGLASPVQMVHGVVADPKIEENGRFWSIVSETLFCFTYDKETKKFNVQEVISFDKTTYTSNFTNGWFPKTVLFEEEKDCLYVSFQNVGGMQRIVLEDFDAPLGSIKVKSNERIMSDIPSSDFMVIGEDGNLYYASDTNLKMFPLNLTDEDWAIAQQVDDQILAIGEEITVESEAAIRTARSAYENLSWRYKSLIQNMEILQEAESDILERKIDTIPETVALEHFQWLSELMDEYKGLNARQQRYVKNYNDLKASYDVASDLNDQKIAADLQKRINALKDKFPLTLDNEPEVLEIRADYKKLTGKQAMLVDTTILVDAEAQIKVLRAELVKYVETLIQAIPDEITLDAEPAITAAREAADKLYTNERKEISYSKLTSAEGKLRTLKNAKAAAEEVDALIKAIGIVTLGDKERIAEAREAYDALNGTALTFLTKGKKLVRAEFILKALQTWGIPAITVVNAGIVFAVLWFVPALHAKVFKTKKKEEETTEVIDN